MDDIKQKAINATLGISKQAARAAGNPFTMIGNYISDKYIYDPVTRKVAPYFQDITVPAIIEAATPQQKGEDYDQFIDRKSKGMAKMAPMMLGLNEAPQAVKTLAPGGIDINNVLRNRIDSIDQIKANPNSRYARDAEQYLEKSANWIKKNGFGKYLEDPRYAYKMDPLTQKVVPNKGLKMERDAVKQWMTTNDPESAAYITSKGELIDSSGRAQTSKDNWPYMKGRNVDHREIASSVSDAPNGGTDALMDYMNKTGNVRLNITPNEANFDVMHMPNDKMLKKMRELSKGKVIVADISDPVNAYKTTSGEFNNFDDYLNFLKEHLK